MSLPHKFLRLNTGPTLEKATKIPEESAVADLDTKDPIEASQKTRRSSSSTTTDSVVSDSTSIEGSAMPAVRKDSFLRLG